MKCLAITTVSNRLLLVCERRESAPSAIMRWTRIRCAGCNYKRCDVASVVSLARVIVCFPAVRSRCCWFFIAHGINESVPLESVAQGPFTVV